MIIVRISKETLGDHIDDLIALSDEFLESLGNSKSRTAVEKREILWRMVEAPQTVLLMMTGGDECPIGLCYYNRGTGYACGGDYIWINGVYVREEFRGRGFGPAILRYVENDALERGAKLIITTRDLDNQKSKRIFEKESFVQTEQIVMTKEDL